MQQANAPHPLSPPLLLALCGFYLLLGLLDHSLWKNEDAVNIGVAWSMAQHGDWLNPALAGEAWPGAPLYYWLAAAFGQLSHGLIEFHYAVRLATAAFGSLLLVAIGYASAANLRLSEHGRGAYSAHTAFDRGALLLLIGSPGLLIPIHEAQPMIAVLAGHALAYWGLARLPKARGSELLSAAGLLLGGILLTALAGDGAALLPLLPLLLLWLSPNWRSRNCLLTGITTLLLAAILLGFWFNHYPSENTVSLLKVPFSAYHFKLLAWLAFPVLPLAIWSLWLNRRHINNPQLLLPLIGSVGSLLVFLCYGEAKNLPALPVLVPLTLLASIGAGRLRRGAANALDWFGMLTFTLAAALVWMGAYTQHFGSPAKWHAKMQRFAPGLEIEVNWPLYLLALAISITWLVLIFLSRRSPWRSTTHWACGVTLTWGLIALLWMPVIDYGKSYRSVAMTLQDKLEGHKGCIGGKGLTDPQRAVLDYYAGIVTTRGSKGEQCRALIVHSNLKRPALPADEGWHKVLETNRPGEKYERFYLYRR